MGDRTSTWTTIAKSDYERVKALLLGEDWCGNPREFAEVTEESDGTLTLTQESVNYGGENQADKLVEAGIPFIIHHATGGSYGEGFIAFDLETRSCEGADEGDLIVPYDPAIEGIRQGDLERVKAFDHLKKRARAKMVERDTVQRLADQARANGGR